MEILTLKIRGDLHKHSQHWRATWTARWRWMQLLVLTAGLVVIIYSLFPQHWPLHQAVPFLLFAPTLLVAALQPFIHARPKPPFSTVLVILVYTVLAFLAALLYPTAPEGQALLPAWTNWLSLAIPVASWAIVSRFVIKYPRLARQYSLHNHSFLTNASIGLAFGAGLALHLFLVAHFITGVDFSMATFTRPTLLWTFCVLSGILVPAEELVLRGAAFSILYDELNMRFYDVVIRVTAVDLLVYLVIMVHNQVVLPFALLILAYRAGLSVLNLFMVRRRRTLLPALFANLTFSVLTVWLFFL